MKYEENLGQIDLIQDALFAASDGIWEAAETAFTENTSADLLCNLLEQQGFAICRPAFGIETAFTATYGSGKPVMGFLGEYDALANLSQVAGVTEKTALHPGGNGHGCGHNLLGVGAAAAAIAVKDYLEKSGKPGTVIYFGCPGEEGGSGKAFMAREGAFDSLDFAITWHPSDVSAVRTGSSLANFQVLFKFDGVSAHAAACPELGRSALDAAELMNVGANFLREHIPQACRLHYAILDGGGYSPNVVQNHAELLYLVRAPKVGLAKEILDRTIQVAQGAALMTGTTMSYELIKSCANLVPNNVMEQVMSEAIKELPLPVYTEQEYDLAKAFSDTVPLPAGDSLQEYIDADFDEEHKEFLTAHKNDKIYDFVVPYSKIHINVESGGSTDVGDVSWQTPTVQFNGATWAPNTPGHSWQAVAQGKGSIAHKGLIFAGKVMATTALKMVENPEKISKARDELNKRLEGQQYLPIPKGIYPRAIRDLVQK